MIIYFQLLIPINLLNIFNCSMIKWGRFIKISIHSITIYFLINIFLFILILCIVRKICFKENEKSDSSFYYWENKKDNMKSQFQTIIFHSIYSLTGKWLNETKMSHHFVSLINYLMVIQHIFLCHWHAVLLIFFTWILNFKLQILDPKPWTLKPWIINSRT